MSAVLASLYEEGRWGDCQQATWHLTAQDKGVVSLTRLACDVEVERAPVIFLPGMFSNRHFWVSPKGVGLAASLAAKGHPCWLIERRGIGGSPKVQAARSGLEEALRLDLPLVQEFVWQQEERPAYWCGHSFGGVTIARAVAETMHKQQVAGLVLFASQFEVGKSSLTWPGRLFVQGLSRLLGRFPAKRLGLGPEDEAIAAMDDACAWTTEAQRSMKQQLRLADIESPVLAIVGGHDVVDPPQGCERFISHMLSADKTYIRAGTEAGFSENYNHPGVVVSKSAANEVWPRVADWLQERHSEASN